LVAIHANCTFGVKAALLSGVARQTRTQKRDSKNRKAVNRFAKRLAKAFGVGSAQLARRMRESSRCFAHSADSSPKAMRGRIALLKRFAQNSGDFALLNSDIRLLRAEFPSCFFSQVIMPYGRGAGVGRGELGVGYGVR
jgi:hypothetical protein